MDKSKRATPVTLIGKGRLSMSKFVKEMASLSSVYDVVLRNIVEKHELGVEENLCGNLNFVLVNPHYHLRKARKYDHVKYDVISPNDLKSVFKILVDMMKRRAHEHVFCYTLQFPLGYMDAASEKEKSKTVPGRIPAKAYLRAGSARV